MNRWEKYKIITPEANSVNKWDKYKILSPKELQEDSLPVFLGKSFGKGLIDGTVGVAKTLGEGVESFKNKTSKMYGAPVGMYGMGLKGVAAAKPNIRIDETIKDTDYASKLPSNEEARNYLQDKTGINLEAKTDNPILKAVGHGAEFAGSAAPYVLGGGPSAATKTLAGMAGIGTASGALQEFADIDPITADLTAIGTSLASKKPAALLKRFTKEGKIKSQEEAVANLLKDVTREENLGNLKEFTGEGIDIIPTTAEVALNKDISNLNNAYMPNLTGIAQRRGLNDQLLRGKLDNIGNNLNPDASLVGEEARKAIGDNLDKLVKTRSAKTADAYKNLEQSKNTYPIDNFQTYTDNALIEELGEIEKGVALNKNILPDKYKKLAKSAQEKLAKLEQELFSDIKQIEKQYPNLGTNAKEQVLNELVPNYNAKLEQINLLKNEISTLESGNYRPSHIDKAITEISNQISALKKSEKRGNKSLIKRFAEQKKNLTTDLEATPEGAMHRDLYKKHSEPINTIEQDKLLKKFVQKDDFDNFIVANDDLPKQILQAPKASIENYVNQVKNSNAEDLTKAYIRDKYLGKAVDSNIPTYDKSSQFLRSNQDKLASLYTPAEMDVFNKINQYLKNRNMVDRSLSSYGSATAPRAQIYRNVENYLGPETVKPLFTKAFDFMPYGKRFLNDNIANKLIRTNPNYSLLEEALIDPYVAKRLFKTKSKTPAKMTDYVPYAATALNVED